MTGGSASCFSEQYRDLLLLYLHQKLDENNSYQQVHTAAQQYTQYTMVCSHVASNSVLFAECGDTSSAVRQQGEELLGERMEGGSADEAYMPPLKCECFDSAA